MRHWIALLAAMMLLPSLCDAAEPADLRDFRVGESVQQLPAQGYTGFHCADQPGTKLNGWQDYATCPRDARGLHAVGFEYDPAANDLALVNDSYEGTRVAGQPVFLALLISDKGQLDGIRIQTDPKVRLYLRKKAFLFGLQARARYGSDGWTCHESPPGPGEEPVGGVFVKEHCEKTTPTRRLIVDRALYREAGQPLKDFTGRSEVLILSAG